MGVLKAFAAFFCVFSTVDAGVRHPASLPDLDWDFHLPYRESTGPCLNLSKLLLPPQFGDELEFLQALTGWLNEIEHLYSPTALPFNLSSILQAASLRLQSNHQQNSQDGYSTTTTTSSMCYQESFSFVKSAVMKQLFLTDDTQINEKFQLETSDDSCRSFYQLLQRSLFYLHEETLQRKNLTFDEEEEGFEYTANFYLMKAMITPQCIRPNSLTEHATCVNYFSNQCRHLTWPEQSGQVDSPFQPAPRSFVLMTALIFLSISLFATVRLWKNLKDSRVNGKLKESRIHRSRHRHPSNYEDAKKQQTPPALRDYYCYISEQPHANYSHFTSRSSTISRMSSFRYA